MSTKTLRNNLDKIHGLRYIVEHLDLHSGLAKRLLLSLPFITDKTLLDREFSNIEEALNSIKSSNSVGIIPEVCIKLGQLHDIQGTIRRISSKEILDDV